MAVKFVIISCLVAVAAAGALPAAVVEPVAVAPAGVVARLEQPDTSSYEFGYDIVDTITGDVKGQYEKRDGPVVTGRYYLDQDNGLRRIVEYFADDINGFNARVINQPLAAPVVAEPVVAEPVAARVVAAPAPAVAPVAPVAPVASPVLSPFSAAYTAGAAPLARFANIASYPFSRFGPLRAPVVAV